MRQKIFTLFLALAASVGTVFAESGTCGSNLTWDLTDGVLTISGTGEMPDWSNSSSVPWYSLSNSITSVTIGNNVTSIGYYAFYGCANLVSATIGNSVTRIGFVAFGDCISLTSIEIPNSVTSIEVGAFADCSGLTSVEIPNSVTSIEQSAFSGCSGLTSVTIPNSVTSIGYYAFYDCSSLTNVTIPNTVTSIGVDAFAGCSGLTSLTIPNTVTSIGNDAFWNVPNIVYNGIATGSPWGARSVNGYVDGWLVYSDDSKSTLLACFKAATGEIILPNSVTSIGNYAFSGCSGLTSVTIPNSVTSIGYYAFYDCSSLAAITIGSSVTSIGERAFSNCSNLTSVTWNAKNCALASRYYDTPFYYLRNQITTFAFGEEVETIPAYLCYEMSNLTSITIPNSVTSIGNYAFDNCSGLTSVTWNAKNCVLPSSERDAPFYYLRNQISTFAFGEEVETIPTYLCYDMSNLTSITIPNSVTSIGYQAFYRCSGMTSIEIPQSVTSIGSGAFSNCSNIKSVIWNAKNCNGYNFGSQVESFVWGDSVEIIPSYICSGMSKLTSITIPNTVTSIGSNAFNGCTGLTSITIPDSIMSIGELAFYGCSNLEVVYINNLASWCKIEFGSADANPLYYAHNLRVDNKKLTNLVIPDDVTRIGSYTFAGGTGLTVVTIPESVTSIGAGAFQDCSNLVAVRCPSLEAWCNIEFGSSTANPIYYVHSLTANGSSLTELVVPESVTTIKDYAFVNCQKLTSATIGNGVTSIGNSAFSGCTGLSLATIGNGVTSIGNSAFNGCSALTSITLGNSVESIGNSAFQNCSKLNAINIPASVTSIGSSAFYYYSQLKRVYINDVAAWCNIAFGDNYANPLYNGNNSDMLYLDSAKLTDLVIPEGIENIGSYRFNNCISLTSVTLPESMSSFESSAFNGCSKIQRLTLYAYAPPTGGPNSGIPNTKCNLYVPEETVDVYANAYWWEDFASVRAIGTARFVNFVDWDKTVLSAQDVLVGESAIAPANPNRTGYTFIGWDKEFNNITEDLTITALYKINTYRVEFQDWDGTVLKVDSVEYQSAATAPEEELTRLGYTFVGWNKAFDNIPGDLTITAQYEFSGLTIYYYNKNEYKYSVYDSYYSNRYYWMTPVEGHEGWYQIEITNPLLSSIRFEAYDLSAEDPYSSSRISYKNASSFDGKNAYYVNNIGWQNSFNLPRYRVEFVDWDGTLLKVDSVEYQSAATAPETPVREGYSFVSWDKTFDNITGDLTITAQYGRNIYYYNPNSNYKYAIRDRDNSSYWYYWMTPVEGHEGWYQIAITNSSYRYRFFAYDSSAENPYDYIHVNYQNAPDFDGTNAYYVNNEWHNSFDLPRYRVEFVDWDGTLLKVDSVEYQSAATAPETPVREGYSFVGWDKRFDNITGDLIVTAQYGLNIYYYNPNDNYKYAMYNGYDGNWYYWMTPVEGHEGWYQIVVKNSVSGVEFYAYDLSQSSPNWNYYVDYTWAGYYDGENAYYVNNQGWQDSFNIDRYKVDFVDWDGTLIKTDSVNYFASAVAPTNPTRTGYNFIGWDKNFSRITEDLVVTAQYEMGENTNFTIYFVNGNDESEIYSHGVVLKVPAAPEIEGFTFLGWRPVASFIETNVIEIEAVYEAEEPTSAPEVYTNPANPAQKLIRNGNVYILTGDKTYTITGQEVK